MNLTQNQKIVSIGAVLLLVVYFYLRVDCGRQVEFYPAGSSLWNGISVTRVEQEYYSFFGHKFKTRGEAISSCINRKIGF